MTDLAREKAAGLAQEYVATIEEASSYVLDNDLRRIVGNAYATAYLRGGMDAIEEYMATCEPKIQALEEECESLQDKLRVSEEQNEALGAVNVAQVETEQLRDGLAEALAFLDRYPIDKERTWPQDRERIKQRVVELWKLVRS